MQQIPVIDLAPSCDEAQTIQTVENACRDVGFMYVVNHGIDVEKITAIRNAVVGYFRRPLDDKLRDRITRDNYRGYIPAGFFSPASGSTDADRYEGYKLHYEVAADDPIRQVCDLYGPNRWPAEPTGMAGAVHDYWRACDDVAAKLLKLLAEPLGVDADWLVELFDMPLTNMTLLHYPATDGDEAGFGIHPHKDTDALTILAGDEVAGLQVRCRHSNEWLEVEPPRHALVVNIGDMMELWSGGYFVSTPHKVVNVNGAERFSFPYFAVPRYDVVISPLRQPQPGFDRESVHVGDVSREVWRTNWPDAAPLDTGFDLGTLED